MKKNRNIRHTLLALLLVLGVAWSLGSAQSSAGAAQAYPNGRYLAPVSWLATHRTDGDVVVVDVRTDEHFGGALIPGAVRMPWSVFRTQDTGADVAEVFVGVDEAQRRLGEHGIARTDTVVLYDSVARDGGAIASYVFWVLDRLGHESMKILDGGIDRWRQEGHQVADEPMSRAPLLYQAPYEELRPRSVVTGEEVRMHLGSPYQQIVDVRSQAEYLGEKGTKGLRGNPLKLGHIPTAYNVNHEHAWRDEESKRLKSDEALRDLFRGLDADRCVVVYCNSGRRSSHAYFVLRLLGFRDVRTYERSWKEWGRPEGFFPVETGDNPLGGARPTASSRRHSGYNRPRGRSEPQRREAVDGYVSCGGS